MSETTETAGAMPVVDGAMPSQNAAPATSEPARDGQDREMGEAGTRALAVERKRADAAEKAAKALQARLEAVESASKTDSEKAIEQARKEGASEAQGKANERIRRSEVRRALTSAGVNPGLLDLAAKADEFGSLKVNDEGDVTGLDDAVEAFKKTMPDLFRTAQARPDFGGGQRGSTPTTTPSMNEILRAAARSG